MSRARHRWLALGSGMMAVLAAAFAPGQGQQEQEPDGEARLEQWLAKRAADMGAWEELSAKWEAASTSTTTPVENLVLPLDHYESGREKGRIRTLLRAEKAHLMGEDLVFAWNVKVEMLLPDGTPDGTLTAEDCLIDRVKKIGYCRGAVDVKKGPDHLKGRGMYFSTDDQFIKLLSECEIRTFRIPASFGRLS